MSDVGSAMDVEEAQGQGALVRKDGDKLLVKDESYSITERTALPVEVQQAIAASGALIFLSTVLSSPGRRAEQSFRMQMPTHSPSRLFSTRLLVSPSW